MKHSNLSVVQPYAKKTQKLVDYYEEAGPDYRSWSKNFNMHFGFYRWPMSLLRREAMLEKMNEEVFNRLQLHRYTSGVVADFGCGIGATLRHGASHFPHIDFRGITLVPWQAKKIEEISALLGSKAKIMISIEDFTQTSFATNSLNGVFAIESSCYASGDSKSDLLNEIHRVLKPGGRFVIADGFRKNADPLKGIIKTAYHKLCNSWALTELANIQRFTQYLHTKGFQQIKVEDISLHVAPAVAHVPFTVLKFLLEQFFSSTKMNKERWNNLKGPLLTMILGLDRKHFGYYLVSGIKS